MAAPRHGPGQTLRPARPAGPGGLASAQRLLDAADVLVTGYRPGAVETLGLELPPGTVRARVSAWRGLGVDPGPWAGRRGFDSIVQAASGIAMIESGDGSTPGALPVQALDHATGYLLAAAVVDALTDRRADRRGRDVDASLARTAAWLLATQGRRPGLVGAAGGPTTVPPPDRRLTTSCRVGADGPLVTTARPALADVDDHPWPAHPWGTDEPSWQDGPAAAQG
ncbi:hypothetical protein GCM10025865_09720 [Paraoerskovia sediminicola]|uniref:CoA-transferase family III n=1 Tax=Paraoerskovia sediminicola TaxID=1138587 RepID=A0ABM8G0U8_9CELL|nr:CoA transferase [Paraoerskovia sediminicola]BDZ41673.1 hypothetical protein GCM10025865_09720 [Paraoerskovia sediminicola]